MSFFNPAAAWLALLALPLIALYFLKLKRPRQSVSSLVLWCRVMNDQRVNSPFQRFKRHLLLFLQLLVLALLVFAATQPFIRADQDRAERIPVLIDCSASMAALDQPNGRSRLDLAKETAGDIVKGLLPDQKLAIISFSREAKQLAGFTDNKSELVRILRSIKIEEQSSDLEHAFRLAQALGRREPFESVILLSDGNFPDRVELDLPFAVDFQKLGKPGPNIGITTCRARRSASRGEWDLFVEVTSSEEADFGGAVTVADMNQDPAAAPLASQLVNLQAGQSRRILFQLPGSRALDLELSLFPNAPFDALASDNRAYIGLKPLAPLAVFTSPSLSAFRHALNATPDVDLYPAETPPPPRYDLVISDQSDETNDDAVPNAPVECLIDHIPQDLTGAITLEPSPCQAIDWKRSSSLLQHVDFSNVIFLDSPRATDRRSDFFINRGYQVLLEGPGGPFIVEHTTEDQYTVYFMFHPSRSTLPYRVGFPIMISNLVQMAMDRAGMSDQNSSTTGPMPSLTLTPNQRYLIRGPAVFGTRRVTAGADGQVPGIMATRTGVYRWEQNGTTVALQSASLLSEQETSLHQRDSVSFREITVRAGREPLKVDRPIWRYLVILALLVFLVEWWFFQRRPAGRQLHQRRV